MFSQYRLVKFGPKSGSGGRTWRGEMLLQHIEDAEIEARNYIQENRKSAVDMRVETIREDGVMHESHWLGQMRWEDARERPVRYPYPDT
jgi:hypothetical protein